MRVKKIYTYSVLGAAGGLLAAVVHRLYFYDILSRPLSPDRRLLVTSLLGLAIGASIAFFPSFSEGRARYDAATAFRAGIKGALFGGIGGLTLGLIEYAYQSWGSGGLLARTLTLGVVGLAVGAGEAFNGTARWWRGLAGGFIGGVLAGGLVELVLPDNPNEVESDAAILALMLLGLCISLFIALFVHVLTECWLEGLPGSKVEGQVYALSAFRAPARLIIGSNKAVCTILVYDVQPQQATLSLTRAGAELMNLGAHEAVRLNGEKVRETVVLRDGDKIKVGSSTLRFRERRRVVEGAPGEVRVRPAAAPARIDAAKYEFEPPVASADARRVAGEVEPPSAAEPAATQAAAGSPDLPPATRIRLRPPGGEPPEPPPGRIRIRPATPPPPRNGGFDDE